MWRQAHVQIPLRARLFRRAVPTALVAVLVAALTAGPADASVVHVPRAYFGLHDSSREAYQHLDVGSLRLWDAGVSWRQIETSPGVYDWTLLDSFVHEAQQHHTQVTLVLAMTPEFYGPAPSLPPIVMSDYENFVRAVMLRYRTFDGQRGIAAYQVWNEGNVSTFWTGTPYQLALMTREVWRIHQQVDPDATIVAPSFAVRLESQRRWLSAYESQRVGRHPVWHYYDANALSLYPKAHYAGRLGGPEDAMRILAMAKHRLAQAGVPQTRSLWATEINYGLTGLATAATPISERRQVAYVIRTYVLGAARGLSRMFWYRYDWGALSPAMVAAPTATLSCPSPTPRRCSHRRAQPSGRRRAGCAGGWSSARATSRVTTAASGPTPASCGTPVGCAPSSGTPSTRSGCPCRAAHARCRPRTGTPPGSLRGRPRCA